jgi:hypothetical protein
MFSLRNIIEDNKEHLWSKFREQDFFLRGDIEEKRFFYPML